MRPVGAAGIHPFRRLGHGPGLAVAAAIKKEPS